ncbi:hypothetical protein CDAR_564541 [Caerostris darwini]|uniref:Uncharacterized protein n=1 Tax=Caerostris darwini TaxID=1538125 RepID=A0AAV4TJX5_9ARAC|nr:hypothetical protein CDAR_564541 [Caerostris darwini]
MNVIEEEGGYCLGGTVRYTQINSVFPAILFPIQLEKRVLSLNDHCLIVVAVPEWRNAFVNKKKEQTSGTKEGPWDCLWREAKETGVIRRGILGDVYTESLSLSSGPDFAGELRGCVTSDKLKTLSTAGRGSCLWGTVRYTQINSVFLSILFPIQLEKRVLSWNDHCLIAVAVPEWRNAFANKKKGQTSGTQEGPWDCLWREAKETGVIRRGILGDVYTESLSLVWA